MNKVARMLMTWVFVLAAFAALSGCQTMAGWFGLATEQYVDDKMSEVQTQLDTYSSTADHLEELIGSMEAAVKTTEELKNLATVLENRLDNLPEETIKQLVDILQEHLDSQ